MFRRARLIDLDVPWHIIQLGSNHAVCFYVERPFAGNRPIADNPAISCNA
jgi:hypothetical protein